MTCYAASSSSLTSVKSALDFLAPDPGSDAGLQCSSRSCGNDHDDNYGDLDDDDHDANDDDVHDNDDDDDNHDDDDNFDYLPWWSW